jgi:DNA-directed RNA polymerase specialized sigma24 family protein
VEVRRDVGREPSPAGRRPRWVLSRDAFAGLLASLDLDPDRAAERYEDLRHKLIVFFAGRARRDPEDQADETLDRLSRRIDEGEPVRDVGRFAYGVARLVLSESFRRDRRRRRALLSGMFGGPAPAVAFDSEPGLECLRSCAARLAADDRDLILGYYESIGRERQQERRALAERFGLTPSALRVRAYRIRRSLEACTRHCLAGRLASAAAPRRPG